MTPCGQLHMTPFGPPSEHATTHPRRRHISVFPQPHYTLHARKTGRALVGGPRLLNDHDSTMPRTEREKEKERARLHRRIWVCFAGEKDWNEWEKQFALFRQKKLPYCEVTYTLLLHGYLLSPRHRSETAYLVLEEMKRVGFVHGALIRWGILLSQVFGM